jgi:hypothetical protein
MDKLTKLVVDCSTGEEQYIPLTDEEIALMEANRIQVEKDEAERLKQEKAIAQAKASAEAKLKALGLSAEEIAALKA